MSYRTWMRVVLVAVLAVTPVAAAAGEAGARGVADSSTAGLVASLRAQLRAGGLAAGHGTVDVCAAHGLACDLQVVSTAPSSTTPLSSTTPIGYGPSDLESAYAIPATPRGSGLIAIIVPGADPNLASDVAIYRAQYGMSPCTTADGCFRQTTYLGGPAYAPTSDPGNPRETEEYIAFEATLDVEMAMAGCPGCQVVEIQTPLADNYRGGIQAAKNAALHIATGVQLAKTLGADAVSMSVSLPSYTYTDKTLAPMMTTPGMALVAASGDDGDLPNAAWPQDLPTVTSVGATSLYRAANDRGWSEVAWHGSGSSCTYDVPPPTGQPLAVSALCGGRAHPHRAASDISAVGDPYTGVAVYDSYAPFSGLPPGWEVSGGTSASAPFVAGLYARAPKRPNVTGPDTVYRAPASAFNDVTIGTTSSPDTCGLYQNDPLPLCNARPGWDGPTGRGTPHGLAAL